MTYQLWVKFILSCMHTSRSVFFFFLRTYINVEWHLDEKKLISSAAKMHIHAGNGDLCGPCS